jgi:hypothetical protein
VTGNPRNTDNPGETSFFTPEIRADVDYVYDYNHPADHTIGGSSEVFRAGEVQVMQLGVGGDFHWKNVRARLMTQFGMYSETTPRNDASSARGNWDLGTAYRYISEAYGGYHFDVMHGINVDAGIFKPGRSLDKAAMTITIDAGCEFGSNSGVSCRKGTPLKPSQYFLGFMAYQRFWFDRDRFAITLGGGAINNPGRYLVLLPPINGATAISGTPYFTENPGNTFKAWDASSTFD